MGLANLEVSAGRPSFGRVTTAPFGRTVESVLSEYFGHRNLTLHRRANVGSSN